MKRSILFFLLLLISNSAFSQLGNKNMYLLSNLNNHGTPYSAVWGYVAPDGREYAILGCYDGTSFVDITDANNIHQVGFIPSTSPGNGNNLWREMKTYSHYAYIVSEVTNSGIQIVDLQYLPDSVHYVKKFLPAGYSSTHSISQSGPYLYMNGASIGQGITCYDLTVDPETPIKRGAFNNEYVHDCRVFNDTIYAANIYSGKVSVINAVNKNSMNLVTQFSNLPGAGPHNTAVTADRKHLLVTDEIGTAPYRLKIWNIEDLGNITFESVWQPTGITTAIVHNVEVYGQYALAAHYSAGIRMIDISNPYLPTEVAWYDTYPSNNNQNYEGCWGVYMFPSGKIAVSDRSTGLYVLKTYFNVKTIFEGYYNPLLNNMNASDTVRAYLRSASSPYSVVDSAIAVADNSTFNCEFKFNNSYAGNYYLVLKQRNCLETWSSSGGINYNPMGIMSYDFTDSDTKAFGNNLAEVNNIPAKYAMYSGDINDDGAVELSDLIYVSNDASQFISGYVISDLTGNNLITLDDMLLVYNNASAFRATINP